MRLQLLCCFFLNVILAKAQQTVVVNNSHHRINLAPAARFIEDAPGKLTINDVLQPQTATRFRPVNNLDINFGVTSSAFWIESKIQNLTDERLFIEIGNNSITEIGVFEVSGNRVIKQYHSGNWLPFHKREIAHVGYLFPLAVQKGGISTVYIRVKHYRGTGFPFNAGTLAEFYHSDTKSNLMEGIYYGFMLLMILYNLFIYFSLRDAAYLYYVNYVFFMGLLNAAINGFAFRHLYPGMPWLNQYDDIVAALAGIAGVLFAGHFLNTRKNAPLFHKIFIGLLIIYAFDIGLILSGNFMAGLLVAEINSLLLVFSFFGAAYQSLRNGYKPAKFFLIAWSFLLLSVVIFILDNLNLLPYNSYAAHSLQVGSAVEALLLSMALANRINVYKKEKRSAQLETLRSLEENKRLITEQNLLLENKVAERTGELKKANDELGKALENLKETQAQLIQSEKMASLGELTAGIAHEIQNPLNFVNNFSEVSNELIDELNEELNKDRVAEAKAIGNNIKQNLEKINHHGKRADAIVKGMLQHSRNNSGQKERTDINALVNEYLRLAFHGLRAKEKSFNAVLETDFDSTLGQIEVIPQDIGRVILNLITNAFYAVNEKAKELMNDYQPTVWLSTKRKDDAVVICVRDNGNGIPQNIIDKIFQPFFTTKPTGQGTGLGLSLAYDIVKAHGGELKVETKEGEGTKFYISIPVHDILHSN